MFHYAVTVKHASAKMTGCEDRATLGFNAKLGRGFAPNLACQFFYIAAQ